MLTALRVAPRAPTASPPRRGRPRGAPARATSARARLAPSSSDADPSARRRASSSSSSASDPERRVSEPSPLALAASMPALSLALPALPATLGAVLASGYAFPATWACAAIPCCLGFLNPVYVFSVGYGLAVASAALGVLAMASASGAWIPALCLAHVFGAVVYGPAVVAANAVVGDGSVVKADVFGSVADNSVVLDAVPAGELWGGAPAAMLKKL